MGEFLHAFEDTYAHRSPSNVPFPLNGGVGHGHYFSHPDYTYNHENFRPGFSSKPPFVTFKDKWVNNESRTLDMENAVYNQIVAYMEARNYKDSERKGKNTPINDLEVIIALLEFNACQVNEGSAEDAKTCSGEDAMAGDKTGMYAKIDILNQALIRLGYDQRLEWDPEQDGGSTGYDISKAAENREKFLGELDPNKYPAAIMPKGK